MTVKEATNNADIIYFIVPKIRKVGLPMKNYFIRYDFESISELLIIM